MKVKVLLSSWGCDIRQRHRIAERYCDRRKILLLVCQFISLHVHGIGFSFTLFWYESGRVGEGLRPHVYYFRGFLLWKYNWIRQDSSSKHLNLHLQTISKGWSLITRRLGCRRLVNFSDRISNLLYQADTITIFKTYKPLWSYFLELPDPVKSQEVVNSNLCWLQPSALSSFHCVEALLKLATTINFMFRLRLI